MTTKPLPAHGTYARAVGRPARGVKGCSCPRCKGARSHYQRRRALLNATGRALMVPAAPAIAHLRFLNAQGAGREAITRATGCSGSTIYLLLRGRRDIIRRTVANAILRVQLSDVLDPGRPVDSTGSVRRIHALMASGQFAYDIAAACRLDKSFIVHLTNGHLATVRADSADKIRAAYQVLCGAKGKSVRNQRRAVREGWAPSAAWDDDTIDAPEAQPDWTGHCGTNRGWYMHRETKQTPCPRCQNAHDQWIASIRHLPTGDRARVMATTRADALSRGAAIAENARELLAQGYTRRHAAERLGISLDRIEAELARHPIEQQAAA